MAEEIIDVLVEGGKASAGPPIGPALGPHGLNVMDVVNEINKQTKDFQGMKVPVKIILDPATKEFRLEIGTPPASALIMEKAGVEKGAPDTSTAAGNITIQDAIDIAKMKKNDLLGHNLKEKTKEIAGTCISAGITINDLPAREIIQKIKEGEFDELFKSD